MDEETFRNNLKTIKELILDEQKLVTYVSLSRELCIHVNEAKRLLNHLVQDIKKSQPETDIHVSYVISGLLDNNSACTTVCSESDVEALRKTLKLKFFEHVYSVSRTQGVDNVALTAINKFEDLPLCTGLIKSNLCAKRSDDELGSLKSSRNQIITSETKTTIIKRNTLEKSKEPIKNGHEDVQKVHQVKSEPIVQTKVPSPEKDVSTNTKTVSKKNGSKSVPKGIAGFFSKANNNSSDSSKLKSIKVKEEKKVDEQESKVQEEVKSEISNKGVDKPIKMEKDKPLNKSQKKGLNNSLEEIKKNAKVDKKRKRVLHVSDSESDNETNDPFSDNNMAVDQDSEDEIPPTPSVNTVKITSGIVNPKKRRKVVDKTYKDEDGFVITKKEEIYESCSDNEEEVKPKEIKKEKENIEVTPAKIEISPKENGKAKKKKVSPPQKGKQQMLTNFFKPKAQ